MGSAKAQFSDEVMSFTGREGGKIIDGQTLHAHMTGDRLIFAGISTLYLLIAMPFEERSLAMSFGRAYDEYRERVRFRIVPYVY